MKNEKWIKRGIIFSLALGLLTAFRGISNGLVQTLPPPVISMPSLSVPEKEEEFDLLPATTFFSVPAELQPTVNFWIKIYSTYTTDQVVFHDPDSLNTVYGVLNISDLDEKEVSQEIEEEKNKIRLSLPESDPARTRIRAQFGLKNKFEEGLRTSGKYMPHFEAIFADYGVPIEITRLAFVESLFKEKALSKVGAAGLWQFMPSTARLYLTVDRFVDERYDPMKATHAAARLLLKNYQLLGTWPLAINAYNSGPGNLQKAVQRLGTRDIAAIITNYRSESYAFASRNFYPSFLAAKHVYDHQEKYFGTLSKE